MSDRKKQHEEEYQYPSDEYIEEKQDEQPEKDMPEIEVDDLNGSGKVAGIIGFINRNRKVLIMLLIVIGAFVAFRLMVGEHKDSVPVKKTTPAYVAPPVTSPNPKTENQLAQLAAVVKKNQSAIGEMQDRLDNMQSAMQRESQMAEKTNSALQALTSQLEKVQKQLQSHQPISKAKPVKKVVPIVFYLKAIIPGRAWVFSNTGMAETISVGDSLPQYGQVKAIDANRGVVMTSSGKVIEYGVDDY